MAVDTLRTNKMRSALTILGVVIGITSIVSITALIRGFDESFKDLFRQIGPSTMFVTKFSIVSFSQGKEFRDLIKRPNITVEDAQGDRALAARRDGGGAAGRRPGHAPRALHPRQQRHQADGGDRRQRELRRDQLDPARVRARVHPGRSGSPAPGGRPGQRARQGAVPRHRSGRQAGAHRPHALHGRRRLRQAAEPARRQPGRRVRDHPAHDLAEGLRRRRAAHLRRRPPRRLDHRDPARGRAA